MVPTIVLAAGHGRRIGGAKALLRWRLDDGRELPLAAAHAEQRLAHESDAVGVVVRRHVADALRPWLPPGAEPVVSTEADELGPAGSICCAARWLVEIGWLGEGESPISPPGPRFGLITPVDCLPATGAVTERLLRELRWDANALAARPRCGGRRGHPVAVRPGLLEPYRRGEALPLRDRLRALGGRTIDVDVHDRSVLGDLDTDADVALAGQGPVRFFSCEPAG